MASTKTLTREQVLALLRRQQGKRSLTALAGELGVSLSYMSDVMLGRRAPGGKVLRRLGLEQRVVYVPRIEGKVAEG